MCPCLSTHYRRSVNQLIQLRSLGEAFGVTPPQVTRKLCYRKDNRTMRSGSNEPLRRYGHSKLSKMAACRQFGFDVTGNSAIRSADPENPILEPNMKFIGSRPLRRYGYSRILGHMEPHFGEGEAVGGQQWHHSKEGWWFPIGSPL